MLNLKASGIMQFNNSIKNKTLYQHNDTPLNTPLLIQLRCAVIFSAIEKVGKEFHVLQSVAVS